MFIRPDDSGVPAGAGLQEAEAERTASLCVSGRGARRGVARRAAWSATARKEPPGREMDSEIRVLRVHGDVHALKRAFVVYVGGRVCR